MHFKDPFFGLIVRKPQTCAICAPSEPKNPTRKQSHTPSSPTPTPTVDPNKLEHGCRMIHAGCPSCVIADAGGSSTAIPPTLYALISSTTNGRPRRRGLTSSRVPPLHPWRGVLDTSCSSLVWGAGRGVWHSGEPKRVLNLEGRRDFWKVVSAVLHGVPCRVRIANSRPLWVAMLPGALCRGCLNPSAFLHPHFRWGFRLWHPPPEALRSLNPRDGCWLEMGLHTYQYSGHVVRTHIYIPTHTFM